MIFARISQFLNYFPTFNKYLRFDTCMNDQARKHKVMMNDVMTNDARVVHACPIEIYYV